MNSQETNKLLLSPKEAAIKLWGVYDSTTRKRMYRFLEQGTIKAEKDGSRYWIPAREIDRYSSPSSNNTKDGADISGDGKSQHCKSVTASQLFDMAERFLQAGRETLREEEIKTRKFVEDLE